ncbi:MAG: CoB--CoM heterodisulfide reductase iron-sulfur subunit B family protein [Acidobacteriota bacterium]|nr:CoB--CoM heterodisulfide reductase iron-sulfur subunit B family protein [Blastocatellia bacterium]MDW8238914.1 CoB--CoM heterodisulfide reductase iron-sulfur subunit B family protein [Acidobacteriota bacterium]
MKLLYYPGCTLRTVAQTFDLSAKAVAAALDIELVELTDFTCCGGLFPQTTDNLMSLLAPARVLVHAQRTDPAQRLMTLCTFCYNTLKRTHYTLAQDAQKRAIVSEYLEEPYRAEVRVVHLLEVLRDDIGYEAISQKIAANGAVQALQGARVAPYYGCLLLRPSDEIGMDDPEQPTILEDLLHTLGCTVVDFPWKTECCGSFLSVSKPELARQCSQTIVQRATQLGAEMLVTTCPLCSYNIAYMGPNHTAMTVAYFTQLLGLALGLDQDQLGLRTDALHQQMTSQWKGGAI